MSWAFLFRGSSRTLQNGEVGPLSSKLWKFGISAWLSVHLVAILITPNRATYLGEKLRPILEPYAHFFELATPWGFFAPDPGPPMRLEYESVSSSGETLGHDYWPPAEVPWRSVALTHFVIKHEKMPVGDVARFLCSKSRSAQNIRIWKVVYGMPDLLEVQAGRAKLGFDQVLKRTFMGEVSCAASGEAG